MVGSKMHPWIAVRYGEIELGWPPLALLIFLLLLAFLFTIIFLRRLTSERKTTLKKLFRNNTAHAVAASGLFLLHSLLKTSPIRNELVLEITGVVAVFTLIQWTYFAIKLGRALIFVALFASNKRVAFPLLFANIASLILSISLIAVVGSEVFNIQVMPLLATSAALSLVLGIALQDTLGNLFAGVALQMDKPYEINDWIEIQNGSQKWVGKIYEISWRATILIAFSEEVITVPNRIMAQSTIFNFSQQNRPFFRSQMIRLPFDVNMKLVKESLMTALLSVEGVMFEPAPFIAIAETTESWIAVKVIYAIKDYPNQLGIADRVVTVILETLSNIGVNIAAQKILITNAQ